MLDEGPRIKKVPRAFFLTLPVFRVSIRLSPRGGVCGNVAMRTKHTEELRTNICRHVLDVRETNVISGYETDIALVVNRSFLSGRLHYARQDS